MSAARPVTLAAGASPHACRNCPVHRYCISRGLEGGSLARFESMREATLVIRHNECLYRTQETLRALYIVRSGILKISVAAGEGCEQITGFYLPGDILGLGDIETGIHHGTATALQTSSICTLPVARLSSLCSELRDLQLQVWSSMSREIMARQEMQLAMGRRDAEVRLAIFLCHLSARMQRLGYSPTHFQLPMTRQEIGNYLGMSTETVSRCFSRLQHDGLIARYHRFVKVVDSSQLHRLCINYMEPNQARPAIH